MPMFKVCVQQYVEETAIVEVEAKNAAEAEDLVDQMLRDGDVDGWEDGDDIIDRRVYSILDEAGNVVEEVL